MKRKMLFALAVLALIFFSCKKKSNEEITSTPADFTRLKIGNYWVYEFYKVDTNGVDMDLHNTDSSYILKDTLINGIKYFVNISTPFPIFKSQDPAIFVDTMYIRDSSGYLLNRTWNGETLIMFARDNFTELFLSDTMPNFALRQHKMTGKDSIVTVPAGTFTTRSMGLFFYPLDPNYPWGIRKYYYIYGRDIGQIKFTTGYYDDPGHYEARLVRYHVE